MVRLLCAVLAISAMVAGCARPGADLRTYVGQVTEVHAHTVCIGGPEGNGECFLKDQVTERLRVNDCVTVTYAPKPRPEREPYRAKKLSAVNMDAHQYECPGR